MLKNLAEIPKTYQKLSKNLKQIGKIQHLSFSFSSSSQQKSSPFSEIYPKKKLHYVGCAIKEGQLKSGVEQAPQALREAGLFEALQDYNCEVVDHGDVSIKNVKKENIKEENRGKVRNTEVLDPLLFEVHKAVRKAALEKNGFVLAVGGDHSIATGSISGMKSVYPNLKVIWIDAHADAVVPSMTDPEKRNNYHGMPASHLMGWLGQDEIKGFHWLEGNQIKEEDIVYISVRDIDNDEKLSLKQKGVKCFTPDHILEHGGIAQVLQRAVNYLDPKKEGCPIYISFDIDGCDPEIAPGTGTKAHGGLNYNESHYILRKLAESGNFVGMDMVEINPLLDTKQKIKMFGDNENLDATETVFLGCDLVLSCVGRSNLFLQDC